MSTPDILRIQDQSLTVAPKSILKAPFDQYSDGDLFDYFLERQTVNYSPVCEPDQIEPGFIDDVLQNRFSFNGETHDLKGGINWKENPSADIEWAVFLQKGYYLVGLGKLFSETGDLRYFDKWIELTESWIEQVEPGYIASDVTGRRIQNWIYAFYYFVHQNQSKIVPPKFLLRFLFSLCEQVNYLIQNLAPARNHRTLELHAVFLTALVFPEFRDAEQWLSFSIEALADNAATDILPDGVHCELSTFYHHIVLKNFLAVKQLAEGNGITMPRRFDDAVRRALEFSLYVHKPDGRIPSLSDGDTRCFLNLLEQGHRLYGGEALLFVSSKGHLGAPPQYTAKSFGESGYHILRNAWTNNGEVDKDARYLVFDCGPLGAGNHGHLDLLNIEVAAYGRSLIVDPGRYTYDESGETNWRVIFRRTRYHNTVEVDGRDQADYRYCEQRRKYKISNHHPKAELRQFVSRHDFNLLHGVVRSLVYSAVHESTKYFVTGEYWLISDILQDRQQHEYRLRFHLSPEAENKVNIKRDRQAITIESPNLMVIQPLMDDSRIQVRVEKGFVSSTYGVKQKAPILYMQRNVNRTVFESLLYPYKDRQPEITVKVLDAEMTSNSGTAWAASAFAVQINSTGEQVQDLFFISHDTSRRRWSYNHIDCEGDFCYIRLSSDGNPLHFFSGQGSSIKVSGKPAVDNRAFS